MNQGMDWIRNKVSSYGLGRKTEEREWKGKSFKGPNRKYRMIEKKKETHLYNQYKNLQDEMRRNTRDRNETKRTAA